MSQVSSQQGSVILGVGTAQEMSSMAASSAVSDNTQRVVFEKLPISKIVSYHSGTILADPEPVVELSEEALQIAKALFTATVQDRSTATRQEIEQIIIKSSSLQKGGEAQRKHLESIINRYLTPSEQTDFSQEEFIAFYTKFTAPAYYYGQRIRLYASRAQPDEVEELILRQCKLNTANGEGLTSLHYVCEFNRPEMIDTLQQLGSLGNSPEDKLNLNAQDKYGWTPLHCAAHHGNIACVKKLLSLKADVNIPNQVGKTCLHLACARNRGTIVSVLLAGGASLVQQDHQGMTPLHEAAFAGYANLYNELARNKKADVNIFDELGFKAEQYLTYFEERS